MTNTGECAFETVIEEELLAAGYRSVPAGSFDREDALFPVEVLGFWERRLPSKY